MRLNQKEIQWICNEYTIGRSVSEISVDTGISISQIKRALAEGKLLNLNWYKTKEEHLMLEYLRNKKIDSLNKLQESI